jgi:hypothetical protein
MVTVHPVGGLDTLRVVPAGAATGGVLGAFELTITPPATGAIFTDLPSETGRMTERRINVCPHTPSQVFAIESGAC